MRLGLPLWSSTLLWRSAEAGCVLALALTCGHFVEGAAEARRAARLAELEPTAVTPLSASPAEEPANLPEYILAAHRFTANCQPSLDLAARDGAQITLTLQADCAADGRVEIRHGGMEFAARMPIGRPLRLTIPALEAGGEVVVRLEGGEELRGVVALPDLSRHRRFVLTSADPMRLQADAEGGWMTQLGDADLDQPLVAQVYTYPAQGSAKVQVQLRNTAATCGQSLRGQTISSRLGRVEASLLRVDLPECAAGPVAIYLKNLDQDVKVASR